MNTSHPRPRRALLLLLPLVLLAGTLSSPTARAEEEKADRMLNLLKKKPRKMSTESWQEERREAARELGRQKDKRAVPILLTIIAKERFDVILEIAIDALGEIGDKRAVAPLKKLLNDPSLDAYVRDAVAGALKKLGEGGETPGTKPGGKPGTKPGGKPGGKPGETGEPGETGKPNEGDAAEPKDPQDKPDLATRLAKLQQPFGGLPPIELKLDADVLAFADRWDIVGGAANVRWDKAAQSTSANLAVSSHIRRQVEKKSLGYTLDGSFGLGFRLINPPSGDSTWDLSQAIQITPELRYYPFQRDLPQLCGFLSGGIGYNLGYADHPLYLDRRFNIAGNVSIGGGPGYGRVLNIGARLRLRRLEVLLKKAGLLSGPIDVSVGNQLIHAWYHVRNRIGTFHQLGYTLDILGRAGLLTKDTIDPATTYRMIRVLDDGQLDDRPSGMMFRLGYGYARTLVKDGYDTTFAFLFATGEYNHQLGTIRSLQTSLRFYYNMWDEPDTFGVTLQGSYVHYLYNSSYDPLGALSATISGGVSNQPGATTTPTPGGAYNNGGIGWQLMLGGSYTRFFSRATRLIASAKAGVDTGSPLILFTLEAQYGIISGSFVSAE
jgi:hypothetical protein